MKNKLMVLPILAVGLLLITIPVLAHHGGAVYDNEKPITLTGTLTRFDFVNPHILIYIDAKGPNGEIQKWVLEYSPPALASARGWTKEMAKPGDQIVYQVNPAKNGAFVGRGAATMTVNGKKVPAE